ncbi:MAG: SLBB domain-containing protein [Verrucomicrobia bacterium]|nr:SLBB domain-containing protein [Verrucomicrobiota bacterium]
MTLTSLKQIFAWSALVVVMSAFAGCSTIDGSGQFPPPISPATTGGTNGVSADVDQFSRLRVGDLIMISFSDIEKPPQKQEVNIPDSGVITLPFNVHVKADGKTTTELEKDIRDAYVPSLFVNLTVSVRADQRFYYVDGEVRTPRAWLYTGETTVLRAVANAGGFTDFANRSKIELRRQNGQRFFVNYKKALKDPKLDLPVYPNDHIIVGKSRF